jgi:hypothetical protein
LRRSIDVAATAHLSAKTAEEINVIRRWLQEAKAAKRMNPTKSKDERGLRP